MLNLRRAAPLAALGVLAAAAPAVAATPTRTQITTPAGTPAVILTNAAQPASVTVSGTSNGGPAPLDLRCDQNSALLIHSSIVPNAVGQFTYTLSAHDLSLLAGRTCTLRALPHAKLPSHRAAFAGPVVAVSQLALTPAPAGPNTNALVNFSFANAQLEGRATYRSLGDCALRGDSVIQASLFASPSLFSCAARVPNDIGGRSGLQVDGENAYPTQGVYSYGVPGLVPITYTLSIDPTTGASTLREIETPVRCSPTPAAFPPSAASCSSFKPAPVRVDRTWVQGANGRTSTVTDTWTSTDGKPHTLDVVYQNGISGTPPAFAFPWTGGQWQVASPGLGIPAPTKQPWTILVRRALVQPDNDPHFPAGAITFRSAPTGVSFQNGSTLDLGYVRQVPAHGEVRFSFVFSRSTQQAQVLQLASAAEAALTPPPCVVPRVLGMTVTKARATLHAAHCTVGKSRHETSKSVKKGLVKAQRPKKGSVLPSNGKVALTVSLGKTAPHHG